MAALLLIIVVAVQVLPSTVGVVSIVVGIVVGIVVFKNVVAGDLNAVDAAVTFVVVNRVHGGICCFGELCLGAAVREVRQAHDFGSRTVLQMCP